MSRAKFALLHRAALDACDALDGVKDGIITDPTRCHFDPQVLQCREGDEGPGCLTAAQLDAVGKVYSGPRDPRTGAAIFPGLEPGSELRVGRTGRRPRLGTSAADRFKSVVFRNPRWDFRTFEFDKDVAMTDDLDAGLINATDPDMGHSPGGEGSCCSTTGGRIR